MSLSNIYQISSQGMTAQRERLEAAAANIANANTTRAEGGNPYRRRDVVFEAADLEQTWKTASGSLFDDVGETSKGVRTSVELAPEDQYVMRFQPGHPDADANGYVRLPDVDPLEETVNMLSAARSFEANVTAFNTAKEMGRASLNLGDV